MGGSSNNRRKTADLQKAEEEMNLDYNNVKLIIAEAVKVYESKHEEEVNMLKAELVVVKNSQQFLSCKYDDLQEECNRLKLSNKQQEEEIKKLETQSMQLEDHGLKEEEKVDAIEQYGRRQNLEIAGIPLKDGENTNKIVAEVAKMVDVDLAPDQISTSHRLPAKPKTSGNNDNKPTAPPPIIVRFVSREIRNRIYGNRQLLRKTDLTKISVNGSQNIYINENLTRTRKRLF